MPPQKPQIEKGCFADAKHPLLSKPSGLPIEEELPLPEGEHAPLVRASDELLRRVGVDPDKLRRMEAELLAKVPGDTLIREHIAEFHALARRAAELSGKDPLTGAYNRRRYEAELARLQQECAAHLPADPESPQRRRIDPRGIERRRLKSFSMIAIDIDKFKEVNDTYSHAVGDAVLKEVVERINRRLRAGDFIARIGGDEFMVIAMDANGDAKVLAKDLGGLIGNIPFVVEVLGKKISLRVTVSIGVASYHHDNKTMQGLADDALYAAKHAGRNAVRSVTES